MNLQDDMRFIHRRSWRGPGPRALATALGVLVCTFLLAMPAAAVTKPFDLAGFVRSDPRAQAMGNAFGAIARGDAALYYNPAGLVQSSFDIHLEGSVVGLGDEEVLSDLYAMVAGSPTPTDISNFLAANLGQTRYFDQQTNYSFIAGLAAFKMGLGAGVKQQNRYLFTFTDQTSDGFTGDDTMDENDLLLDMTTISAAFPLLEGQMLLGVTLKRFTLQDLAASQDFATIIGSGTFQLNTVGDSHSSQAYDVGIIWRMETFAALRGQFSIMANNVGGLSLVGATNTLEIPATYDVGFAINPELPGSPVHFLFSAEYEDATGAAQVYDPALLASFDRSTAQKLHLGAELGFWATGAGNNVLSVRFGNNRGQATYGAELNLWFFRLLYARYKDDVGYDGAPAVHAFRVVQASVGLGF
jgi:hypothetical protein